VSYEPSPYDMPEGLKAPGRIDGRCIGHRIEIEAPPELVWDFVADFEGWDAWNPLYPSTSGAAEEGAMLRFTAKLPGSKPRPGKAQVRTVRPQSLFEFGLRSLGGLLQVLRFVEVHEVSQTRSVVVNGDIWGGPLGRILLPRMIQPLGEGLEAMNLALRQVAERKWRGHQG